MELQISWFFLWGLLWAIYFMTDGFDFGAGVLSPFLAQSDDEKRIILNSIGPVWDGNEVWLITAGGVTFAAFPQVYAVLFSSLYSALMIILFALIIRGVSFEMRNKVDSPSWRKLWDVTLFIGSFIPALLFGVAFANIFQGIPFDGQGSYHGSLVTLLNFYGFIGGILFLLLFLFHGALWISLKSEQKLQERAIKAAKKLWPFLIIFVVLFLLVSWFKTRLYDNYVQNPLLFIIPLLTGVSLIGSRVFLGQGKLWSSWFSSCLTIVSTIFFGIAGLYPNLLPSSLSAAYDLTAFNASASPLTLKIMLVVVLIFIPLVIGYQIWAYALFRDPITREHLSSEEAY